MIEKLEFEMKKARDDSEKSTEARIARLKAKHETEIGNHIFFSTKQRKIDANTWKVRVKLAFYNFP